MKRRQMLIVILVNLLFSVLVSAIVVWAGLQIGLIAPARQPTPYVIVPPTFTPTPDVTPTATRYMTSTPTIATETYEVQPGDTLFGIAARLGLDVDLLLRLNQLENANRLLVGQLLLVPLGSLPTPTATATPAPPTATPTLTPTVPISAALPLTTSLDIPLPVILDLEAPGDLAGEAVLLGNRGQVSLSLRNWAISRPDGRRYIFPDVRLEPGGQLRLHTASGVDDRSNLYWAQDEVVWSEAAAVVLQNQSGQIVDTFSVDISGE